MELDQARTPASVAEARAAEQAQRVDDLRRELELAHQQIVRLAEEGQTARAAALDQAPGWRACSAQTAAARPGGAARAVERLSHVGEHGARAARARHLCSVEARSAVVHVCSAAGSADGSRPGAAARRAGRPPASGRTGGGEAAPENPFQLLRVAKPPGATENIRIQAKLI